MSVGSEQDKVAPGVDAILPEDGVDISKVRALDTLSGVAQSNSNQLRALQRKLVNCRENPTQAHLIEPLEEAIGRRQQRGIKLVRQRTALQAEENLKRRTVLEEALRPTVGVLNNDRRAVMNQLIDLCERVKALRLKHTDHTPDQRRLEARLKMWESSLTAMILGLERLASLPTDLE